MLFTYVWVFVQHFFSYTGAGKVGVFSLNIFPAYFEYLDEMLIALFFLLYISKVRFNHLHSILLLFIPLSVIGAIVNDLSIIQTLLGLRSLFQNLLFIIIIFIASKKLHDRLMIVTFYLAGINSIVLLLQWLVGYVTGYGLFLGDLGYGIFGSGHTHVAAYLNLSMLLVLLFADKDDIPNVFLKKRYLFIIGFTSLLMEAKAGYIAFLIAFIIGVFFYTRGQHNKIRYLSRIALLSFSFVVIYTYVFNLDTGNIFNPKRMYDTQTLQVGAKTTGGRVVLMQRTFEKLANSTNLNLLVGFGSGNYLSSASRYFGGYNIDSIRWNYDNYIYNSQVVPFVVVLFGEYGYVGAMIFLGFLFLGFYNSTRMNKKYYNGVSVAIIFFCIVSLSENIIEQQQSSIIFWMLTSRFTK